VRMAAAVGLLVLLALSGCETTAEKSAQLEKAAKHTRLAQTGLQIAHASTAVKVVSAAVLHDTEGAAAVVTLRNLSRHVLREVPIAIDVESAGGRTLFQNNAPGLETALVSIPSLAPGAEQTWVDDQVPASGAPATVSARVGEAPAVRGSLPAIEVQGVHLMQEASSGTGAAGTVKNRSRVAQRSLVVFAVARRAGKIVAAGRAVLAEVPAGATAPWQLFFIGNPSGAKLETSAPATTLN
jgi:glucose/arabinose dehydrogenase